MIQNKVKQDPGAEAILEKSQSLMTEKEVITIHQENTEILLNTEVDMEIIKEANPKNPNRYPPLHIEQTKESKADEARKADNKKVDKTLVDLETKGYDYKDDKNIDNLNGEEFRLGLKFEMDKA